VRVNTFKIKTKTFQIEIKESKKAGHQHFSTVRYLVLCSLTYSKSHDEAQGNLNLQLVKDRAF
jgi:hypothetical protein